MAARYPSEVLSGKLRDLLEQTESELSDATDLVIEKLSGRIERLIEMFGPEEIETNLKYYVISGLPRTLHEAFGPVAAYPWQDKE